jgi:hypothetical protein
MAAHPPPMAVAGLQEKRPVKKTFSALQRRFLQAIVSTMPSITGDSQFGLLQYVGHVRPKVGARP